MHIQSYLCHHWEWRRSSYKDGMAVRAEKMVLKKRTCNCKNSKCLKLYCGTICLCAVPFVVRPGVLCRVRTSHRRAIC